MVDNNIRTDYSKLRHLIRVDKTFGANASVIQKIVSEGSIVVDIVTAFPAENITKTENFDATDTDIAALKEDAVRQLLRYAADEKVQTSKGHTELGLITVVFKGWELVVVEKL